MSAAPDPTDFAGPESCEDTPSGAGVCAAGFTFRGVFYGVGCGRVRPDAVSDSVVATGTYNGVPTELRQVANIDPTLLLATRRDDDGCKSVDAEASAWTMVGAPDRPEYREAFCSVNVEVQRAANYCPAES